MKTSIFNTGHSNPVPIHSANSLVSKPKCSLEVATTHSYSANVSKLDSIAKEYLGNLNPYENLEKFLKVALLAAHKLPEELKLSLYDFKLHGNAKGYFVIHSLPVDNPLIDTPEILSTVAKTKQTFHSEFWLSAIGGLMGHPFSYIQENDGNLYHNVRPTKTKEEILSSESSKALLDLHSETAFHPFYPAHLLLYCLRGDRNKEAKTIIASLASIKNDLSQELEEVLRKPLFKTGIDFSFGSTNGLKGNGPTIPILYGDKEDPLIIFDPDLMEGVTKEANEAIHKLKIMLDGKKEGVLLERGDLVIIDNLRALHGRNKFKPYYDGQDRWLQRLYVNPDLTLANKLFGKKERIISYKFPL